MHGASDSFQPPDRVDAIDDSRTPDELVDIHSELNPAAPTVKLPTVLLVDDDNDSLYLLEHILARFACEIVAETDGNAALRQAKALQPDLILLDIWLPGKNGLDIVSTLRQDSASQTIPIIAVTALASSKDRERILAAGCTHYISKPYTLETMEALLQNYLQLVIF